MSSRQISSLTWCFELLGCLLPRIQRYARTEKALQSVAELACLEESFEANIQDYIKLIDCYGKENRVQDAENTLLLAMKRRGFICDQVTLTIP
ncbi:hypothetical protein L1049_012385 [Liquidambar formosana]|uniref:Pentatricopeptide repeat-containing protein n=1 Tax=Liquidambar formosana TaxID=63359 RepID=A0AAP0R411_LIQFO